MGRVDRTGQSKIPRMRFAVAKGTVQELLLINLLRNDGLVEQVEPSKKGIREMLLGKK